MPLTTPTFWKKYSSRQNKAFSIAEVSPFFNTNIEHCIKEKELLVYSFSNNNLLSLIKPDKLTNEVSLTFTKTAGKNSQEYQVKDKEHNLTLGIGLRTLKGHNQFVLGTDPGELQLHRDDCITIMFKNRTALTFVLSEPLNKNDNRNEAITGLTLPDLEKLAFQKPIAWHYFSHENPKQYSGSFSEKASRDLQEMAGCFYRITQKHKLLKN